MSKLTPIVTMRAGVIAMAARRMIRVGLSLATFVVASAGAGATTAVEAGGSAGLGGPAVSVRIPGTIHEGQRGQFLIDLGVRCRSGLVPTELEYTQRQFDWEPATGLANVGGIVCDGTVTVMVSPSYGEFQPGRARIDASINLLDVEQFDPVDQTRRSSRIRLVRA